VIRILSTARYRSLLRAAHEQMVMAGRSDATFSISRTAMLVWRLSGGAPPNEYQVWQKPFEFIATHDTDTVTIVFVVHNGKPLMIEDPLEMFPSDQLVAQLRLLL